MLKFSGFADLTSCRKSLAQVPCMQERIRHRNHAHSQQKANKCSVSWRSKRSLVNWMPQEHRGVHLEAQALSTAVPGVAELLEQQSIDTEEGMLSGISQKHNMRSSPCRFTEFCNSQCLSHFAAPFIVVRAETSVAESCKGVRAIKRSRSNSLENQNAQGYPAAGTGKEDGPILACCP